MNPYEANLTHDGYVYTKEKGLKSGLHTYGVIEPVSKINKDADEIWEAIVIGSGYAGLVAARDLVKAGEWA